MFNKVILAGYLTRDIDLKYTPSGVAVAKTGIATNRTYKDPTTGENKQETMFIDIIIFGRSAEIANQYLKKGSKVLIEGRLVFEQWVAQDGTKRSKHSVVGERVLFLDSKNSNNEPYGNYGNVSNNSSSNYNNASSYQQQHNTPNTYNNTNTKPQSENTQEPKIPSIDIDEDDIPF